MVKYLIIAAMVILMPLLAQKVDNPTNTCNSNVIKKARSTGFRSLKFDEKIQYYLDLKKCGNKNLVKMIKKEVNTNQLNSDADNSKFFFGKTTSCAYCVIAILVYLTFA